MAKRGACATGHNCCYASLISRLRVRNIFLTELTGIYTSKMSPINAKGQERQ